MNKSTNQRQTALITGASSGIGRDYAHYLAAHDFDLVITARRTARLTELARELNKSFGTKVKVIAADLAKPETPVRLAAEIAKQNIQIDYLVNNAGYSVPNTFDREKWNKHRDMIQVMAMAVTELCHIFAPLMAARGTGYIVNVASVAAYIPGSSGDTLYTAIKAYVVRLSQSLYLEYRNRGVNVIAVCPGYTYSEFHDVNGSRTRMNRMPQFVWLEGPRVVSDAHTAVEAGKGPVLINGLLYRLLAFMVKSMPENLLLRLFFAPRRRPQQSTQPPQAKLAKAAVKKAAPKKKPATKTASKKAPRKKSPVRKPRQTKN